MGLDVSLYHCANTALADQLEAEYKAGVEQMRQEMLGNQKELTGEQEAKCWPLQKELAKKLGLDRYGEYPREEVCMPSKINPTHLFRIGYFRSSYNSGGFNTVLDNISVPNLYDIFEPPKGGGRFTPNWDGARTRVLAAIKVMQDFMTSPRGKFACYEVYRYDDKKGPQDCKTALAAFYKEHEENAKEDLSPMGMQSLSQMDIQAYTSGLGFFDLGQKPMKVRGIINGGPNKFGIG